MRILFGIAIAAIIFLALCAFVPDTVAKTAYQIKAYAASGNTGKVYQWIKVESSPSPSVALP